MGQISRGIGVREEINLYIAKSYNKELKIQMSSSGSTRIRKIIANEIDIKSSSGSMNIGGSCDKVNIVSTSGSSQVELENMRDEISQRI